MIDSLKIGNVKLENNLILAPMAGFSDVGLRSLARRFGASLTVTEMVSAKALYYKNEKTQGLLLKEPNDVPCAAQIFGSEPQLMADMIGLPPLSGFEIIDINMGCPMQKITSNGEGSTLLRKPDLVAQIVEKCAKAAAPRPLTVKIRSGYSDDEINCALIAQVCESAGAAAVTLHARTRSQMYTGKANLQHFECAKKALKRIPLIASGDIAGIEDIERYAAVGADGFMIGRAALGNPQIFASLLKKQLLPTKEVIAMHIDILLKHFPSRFTALLMRGHCAHYLKGMHGGKELKQRIFKMEKAEEIIAFMACAIKAI